jgi:hypothetical protein
MLKLSGHPTQTEKALGPTISVFRRTGTWFFTIEMDMPSGLLIPTLKMNRVVI